MRKLKLILLVSLLAAVDATAQEQAAPKPDPKAPVRIPAPHGEAMVFESDKALFYDDWHFASVRVADGIAYISGVVAGAPGEPLDAAGFEASAARAFRRIEEHLVALGGSAGDIVNLMTFHVFGSKHFTGDKRQHLDAFRRAKDSVIKEPYPAWTAIGVAELLPEKGIVEIHAVAHLPRKP